MPDPRQITKPKQLLFEGRDMEVFFAAFLRKMDLVNTVQIQNFGGKDELLRFLKALLITPGDQDYIRSENASLGIIRDAETGENAFEKVCTALRTVNLTEPNQIEEFAGSAPKVGVLILPDKTTSGMLEDLCLRSVENEPVMQCIDEYFSCVARVDSLPSNISKARARAFLASRFEHATDLGVAVHKGYWPWEHPAFNHVRKFLENLR